MFHPPLPLTPKVIPRTQVKSRIRPLGSKHEGSNKGGNDKENQEALPNVLSSSPLPGSPLKAGTRVGGGREGWSKAALSPITPTGKSFSDGAPARVPHSTDKHPDLLIYGANDYACRKCNKTGKDHSNMRRHIQKCKREYLFTCGRAGCGEGFVSHAALKEHMQSRCKVQPTFDPSHLGGLAGAFSGLLSAARDQSK